MRRPAWLTALAYAALTVATAVIAYPLLFILLVPGLIRWRRNRLCHSPGR